MAEKRVRAPGKGSQRSKKRQKLGGEETANVTTKPSKKSSGPFVNLDQLNWQAVSLPDRFDDAEGFFGLEEIDDVDVIRPQQNAPAQYRVSKAGENKPIKGVLKTEETQNKSAEQAEQPDDAAEDMDDEEWGGFDSDGQGQEIEDLNGEEPAGKKPTNGRPQANGGIDAPSKAQKKSEKEAKKLQKPKKEKKVQGLREDAKFSALPEGMDEDAVIDTSAWNTLGLSSETLSSLANMKFAQPTAIQSSSIPEILAGHDVIGKASTGSGKTLAYGIPILEHYLDQLRKKAPGQEKTEESAPIALIMSPTRELAHQLSEHLTTLCSGSTADAPNIATLTGGLSIQKQQRLLAHAHIVIGTPGRLWEVISGGQGLVSKLKQIKFLVIDEADRLLSEGHFKEAEEILNALDREDENEEGETVPANPDRQTLVFSATFHKGLQQKLAGKGKGKFMNSDLLDTKESMEYLLKKLNFREPTPRFIDVNPASQMAEGLKEGLIETPAAEKVPIHPSSPFLYPSYNSTN